MNKNLFKIILILTSLIAFILSLNRIFSFLPSTYWIIFLNHLIAGFLILTLLYLLILKITKKEMLLLSLIASLVIIFVWEGVIQKFKSLYQIGIDCLGIIFSLIYVRLWWATNNRGKFNQ